jgi:RNA polymerase sigma-70 factor (ECF subfamily)
VDSDSNSAATFPLGSDLIRRAQQGDSDAFAALFHAHKARIFSLCLHMTNDAADAEDLAQDAFLHVFRKLSTFRGDSALSTWLYRIAVNTVLMRFRKKSPCHVSLDAPYSSHEDGKPMRRQYGTRDGRVETCVTRVALTRAISELPEGYRRIFLLHEVEGYEHGEIAELLGCSVGTSKSQLHKAKMRMRNFLSCRRAVPTEIGRSERPSATPIMEKWKPPIHQPRASTPCCRLPNPMPDGTRGAKACFRAI